MTITRRQALQLAGAAGALAAMGLPARAQADTDTLRMGIAARGPRHSDPNLTTQGSDNWATEQMYEQLVRPEDGDFAVTPDQYKPTLATSWTSTPDARGWTFQLRPGVQFHKGYGEMTSDDVVYSFKRAMNEGTNRTILSNIEDVVANGPLEVTMTLRKPDPLFLGTSAFNNNTSIVSKKAAEEMGERFATDAVGTGPYELVSFASESGTKLKRHEGYWGEKAKIGNIENVYIADTTARTLALLAGNIDIMEAVRAPGWVDSMKGRDPTLVFDMTVPGSFNTLHVNLTRPPFDQLKVRQALMHAIDREAVSQALAPMGGVLAGLQPANFPAGFSTDQLPEELRYPYDPERARALLAEAGFPDGISFSSLCSQREDYASTMLIVQEQLRLAGFNMDLRMMDHTAYHADNRSDKNTLAMHSSSYPPIPTQIYFQQLSSQSEVKGDGSGGGNYSHYGTAMPGIDGLLEQALNSTTYDDYVKACSQIELQVLRDLPLIGLSTLSFTTARSGRVDLGYPVKSGYARWRFHRATKSA
ncbi:ABC transporter substrate-binding protein [Aureimonas jatrophae]|uniref:Peptide/nickel transport system substrate-binding protein n=1 Tax=Aureimonas jatrophae TaxID=1166073 RepID=A0A1H0HSG4_9HYPH|nr:ABC transporter substrate-binding protein [Aureimonas jatrophae]MBB3950751.1 peptide/nickel transport system substrate-binding protein [Aureimonas jatrophae]SDO22078.1 peptide/nickel transport system substrate-binding protein [Aureimonas jatrophae]